MNKILISSCLLGQAVRYNGLSLKQDNDLIKQWIAEDRLISVCPEVSGGMSIPRTPAEIVGGTGEDVWTGQAKVIDELGFDVTQFFKDGAYNALELCQINEIGLAILTERSPSCGSHHIYNGQFNKTRINGFGVTTSLLRQHGIKVFSQYQITEVSQYVY